MMLRLSLFSKIVQKKHYHLLSLLYLGKDRDRSYIRSLIDDFRALCNIGTRFEFARVWSIQRWVQYVREHYKAFNTQIRTVLTSPETTRYLYGPPKKKPNTQSHELSHPCGHGERIFNSYQQMQVHMWSKHDYLHPAHLLVDDTHCSICLTQFHTRTRLLEHIMYKGTRCKCFLTLCTAGPCISYEQAKLLNIQEAASNKALAHRGLRSSQTGA